MYRVLRLTMPLIFTSMWLVGLTEVKAQQRTKDAFIKMPTREKADRILSVFERHLSLSADQLISVREITAQFATRIEQVWHSNIGKYSPFK